MFSLIKALFKKKSVETTPAPTPARGVIARAESETSVITVTHKSGDVFEIMEHSKSTGQGSGAYRYSEHKAMQHFHFYRSLYNAKVVAL